MSDTDTRAAQPALQDKWWKAPDAHVVQFFHERLRENIQQRFSESGQSWEEFVQTGSFGIERDVLERIEGELLETGYRFEPSAQISQTEAPEKYKAQRTSETAVSDVTDEQGRAIVATGDNVFRANADVTGTVRFVSSVETVIELLTEGVPPNTVAVIDDSGGTLTAPILEHFSAVLCLGGTVRSHLGILTREYGVPCLMAVELNGLSEGDIVTVESTKPALDVNQFTANNPELRAKVWRAEGQEK